MQDELLSTIKEEYRKLLDEQLYSQALPLIKQAANWADLDSQILVKDMSLHQLYGCPLNYADGFAYAKLAAFNGDAASMYDLAQCFYQGHGVEKDYAKALYFFQKAAENGIKDAYDDLGLIYLMGYGTQRDLDKAAFWLEKADESSEQVSRHKKMLARMQEKAQREA